VILLARPCKSVATQNGHQTEEEKLARQEQEELLKGSSDKIKPSSYLSKEQKKLFKTIVKELEASGILGNLDIYVLETTVIAIDRLKAIEKAINEDIEKLYDKNLMATKDKYTKDLWRGCNELSLSPQSRAKLGNLNVQTQNIKDDELLKVLRGDD
jgi:P27 family predicted phage terminase small subunit